MSEAAPEFPLPLLSPADMAINDHEAMSLRLSQLRATRDTARELGDSYVVYESQLTIDALSQLKGSLLE